MSERAAPKQDIDQCFNAPRITVAMLLFAPLAMWWSVRHPTLSRSAQIGLLAIGTFMMLAQVVFVVALFAIGVLGALPPWFSTTLFVLLIAIVIMFAAAIIGSRKATFHATAWGWAGAGAIAALLLFAVAGKPIQSVQAIDFRLPMLLTAHMMLDRDAQYFTIGDAKPAADTLDLRNIAAPDEVKTQAFSMRGCTFRVAEPLGEQEFMNDVLHINTSRGHVSARPATPLSHIVETGAQGFRPMSTAFRALIEYESDHVLHEAIYEMTYDDVRAARTIEELVKRESLYAMKVFHVLPPPVERFEGDGLHGYFSVTHDRAAADVFDAEGNHILDMRVVAMDIFADEDLLRAELLNILSTLRCDE